jgi:purine-nucleoside phosphorylase
MASGMGMPSMGIYSYELFNFYGVENIIRVGSAGALQTDLKTMDVVAGMGACTDSNFAAQFGLPGTFAPIASYKLLRAAEEAAAARGVALRVGNVVSSDVFYGDSNDPTLWAKMGVLACEMEAAALYMNAARAGKNALCLVTISDHMIDHDAPVLTSQERQESMVRMLEIALDVAAKMG